MRERNDLVPALGGPDERLWWLSTMSFGLRRRADKHPGCYQIKADFGPRKQYQATSDHKGVCGERKNDIRERIRTLFVSTSLDCQGNGVS